MLDKARNKVCKPQPQPQTQPQTHSQNITRAAKPTREIFDAFNSSSTGHQRAENRLSGSTHWRDSRSAKLAVQFASGPGGGRRIADTVGAGSEGFGKDGRTANGGWLPGAKGLRSHGQRSLWDAFGEKKNEGEFEEQERKDTLRVIKVVEPNRWVQEKLHRLESLEKVVCPDITGSKSVESAGRPQTSQEIYEDELLDGIDFDSPIDLDEAPADDSVRRSGDADATLESGRQPPLKIFRNLTVYVNGSTAPLMSDHKLKRILVDHGANLSIALGRRSVTHVILGRPNSSTRNGAGAGAGGGLASGKIQREMAQTRNLGTGVRFVTAEWVVQSVRVGKRLPEGRFEAISLAPPGVRSVASVFGKK